MELVKNVSKWGNSAGILLPKEWIGSQVKVVLIDRTSDIKKEIFKILDPYLNDVIGVYLIGSYSRGEQERDSDVDVIAISKNTKKEIVSGKYHVSIITLESVEKTLEKNPILIFPRLVEAKPILNKDLLKRLKSEKINKDMFGEYFSETKRIIKINKAILNLDKEQENEFADPEIIYSLVLRLRGMFLIDCLLSKEKYSKKKFMRFLGKGIGKNMVEEIYAVYKSVRDNKKTKKRIKLNSALGLLSYLEQKVKRFE